MYDEQYVCIMYKDYNSCKYNQQGYKFRNKWSTFYFATFYKKIIAKFNTRKEQICPHEYH